jgi:AmmeMemoRadiSam system protein A
MSFTLTEHETSTLLLAAREAIASRLEARAPRIPDAEGTLMVPCGAFVTLRSGGELRGCIGHVTAARPLLETVTNAALSSAFEDPRFPPLTRAEWPAVRIEISVLSPLEKVTDRLSVLPGEHGVLIRRGRRSGLLLPQVATEQGWDRDTLLGHACRKAGLAPDAWQDPETSIERFTALVFHEEE